MSNININGLNTNLDYIAILGPTASGKTDLAIQLAKKIPIEVIIESKTTAIVRYVLSRNGVNLHCLYSHDAVINFPTSKTDPIMTTGQNAPGKIVANPITE